MGILSAIFEKIFPPSHPAVTQDASAAAATAATPEASGEANLQQSAPAAAQLDTTQTMPEVDVERELDGMPSADTLNWRTSIVDLLKLLDLDSSFQARISLAHELGFTGSTADSATMNIWLHQQVMSRIAANGGKLPANLH